MRFSLHTSETAPPASQEALRRVETGFGFLPALFGKLAESSTALAAYLDLRGRFESSSLSPVEQQVVALAVSVENRSMFCTSAHCHAARHLAGVPDECITALREQRALPNPKLDVLARLTRGIVRRRGRLGRGDYDAAIAAGYSAEQLLDVLLGVALKTFTNYASHIVQPPLNAEFAAERWEPPGAEPEPAPDADPDETQVPRNGQRRH